MKAILVSAALGLFFVSGCGGGQEEEPVRTETEAKQIQTIVSKTDMRSIVSARMDILMVEGKPPKLEAIGKSSGSMCHHTRPPMLGEMLSQDRKMLFSNSKIHTRPSNSSDWLMVKSLKRNKAMRLYFFDISSKTGETHRPVSQPKPKHGRRAAPWASPAGMFLKAESLLQHSEGRRPDAADAKLFLGLTGPLSEPGDYGPIVATRARLDTTHVCLRALPLTLTTNFFSRRLLHQGFDMETNGLGEGL